MRVAAGAPRRPLAVSLYCGAGGLCLGFEQAGFDVVAAVDADPVHLATHEYNFPLGLHVARDLAVLSPSELGDAADPGKIDVVFGGPPCQGFSTMGKRDPGDSRNSHVLHFVRLVVGLRPRHFVMENVPGILQGRMASILGEAISVLTRGGYDVASPRVICASSHGVPQERSRMFLLGSRRGLPLPSYPVPTTMSERRGSGILPGCPSVSDALGDLPDVDAVPGLEEGDRAEARLGRPSAYAAILRGDAVDPLDFSWPRRSVAGLLTSSARTRHSAEVVRRFDGLGPGEEDRVSRLSRLDPGGTCPTLRAGTGKERGGFTAPRPVHPFFPRVITVREAARLHSFPDWFRFNVTKWHGFRQVGNAVPPLLARAVASGIACALGAEPERPRAEIIPGDESLLGLTHLAASMRYGVDPVLLGSRIVGEADGEEEGS